MSSPNSRLSSPTTTCRNKSVKFAISQGSGYCQPARSPYGVSALLSMFTGKLTRFATFGTANCQFMVEEIVHGCSRRNGHSCSCAFTLKSGYYSPWIRRNSSYTHTYTHILQFSVANLFHLDHIVCCEFAIKVMLYVIRFPLGISLREHDERAIILK